MIDVRAIERSELDDLITIVAGAYPGINIFKPEEKQKMQERMLKAWDEDPTTHLFGAFRDGALIGGMRLFDFRVNLFGTKIDAGGVGLVAVDLLHKKEHVAKELIGSFIRHYQRRGATLAMLYPFRPDFYKRMGFGYGTKANQYRIKPASLPRGTSKANVRYLTAADAPALLACYQRFAERNHGLFDRSERHFPQLLSNPEVIGVGYERNGAIEGYLCFNFKPVKPDHFMLNDAIVQELVYENSAALGELLAFLHAQADQINAIVLQTQDEAFHHLLTDPRNGTDTNVNLYHESNTQGVGLMYRVINAAGSFGVLREHNFGGQSVRLKLTIADSFIPDNAGSTVVAFENGQATISDGAADVAINLDIADFSSLLVGAVGFKALHRYGLARISDEQYLDTVHRLFLAETKPICMTRF